MKIFKYLAILAVVAEDRIRIIILTFWGAREQPRDVNEIKIQILRCRVREKRIKIRKRMVKRYVPQKQRLQLQLHLQPQLLLSQLLLLSGIFQNSIRSLDNCIEPVHFNGYWKSLSELEKVISGSFSSSVAGESVQIIVNGSDTLTILKKQGNVISG